MREQQIGVAELPGLPRIPIGPFCSLLGGTHFRPPAFGASVRLFQSAAENRID